MTTLRKRPYAKSDRLLEPGTDPKEGSEWGLQDLDGPGMKATGNEVAIEEIVVSHERIEPE